jgi:hypothetical protein
MIVTFHWIVSELQEKYKKGNPTSTRLAIPVWRRFRHNTDKD